MIDDKLLSLIKDAYVAEVYAVNFAWQCSVNVKGLIEYPIYKKYWKHNYEDEEVHRDLLASLLSGYGETVTLPDMEIPVFSSTEEALAHQYQNEIWAIERYTRMAKLAQELGNEGLASKFADLAFDEEQDRIEIIKRLGEEPQAKVTETLPGDPMAV